MQKSGEKAYIIAPRFIPSHPIPDEKLGQIDYSLLVTSSHSHAHSEVLQDDMNTCLPRKSNFSSARASSTESTHTQGTMAVGLKCFAAYATSNVAEVMPGSFRQLWKQLQFLLQYQAPFPCRIADPSAIGAEVACLLELVRCLHEHLNSFSPIMRLLVELLLEIFRDVVDCDAWSPSLVACTHVCCQWRAIMTTSPQFWAHAINLTDDGKEWVAILHSSPLLLDVCWDYTFHYSGIIYGSTIYRRGILMAANKISLVAYLILPLGLHSGSRDIHDTNGWTMVINPPIEVTGLIWNAGVHRVLSIVNNDQPRAQTMMHSSSASAPRPWLPEYECWMLVQMKTIESDHLSDFFGVANDLLGNHSTVLSTTSISRIWTPGKIRLKMRCTMPSDEKSALYGYPPCAADGLHSDRSSRRLEVLLYLGGYDASVISFGMNVGETIGWILEEGIVDGLQLLPAYVHNRVSSGLYCWYMDMWTYGMRPHVDIRATNFAHAKSVSCIHERWLDTRYLELIW
ncbi:hypothetical protein EDC04DRAFT_2599901 [Pisolithus marmoratus]|nr:hypothetical protein EDC04DRAFT_2599901 [Pisolithus marmoratus]